MAQRLLDFYVQEASEYLDKLSTALSGARPDADALRRLGRALRGSSRMADQEAIAEAAGALQGIAADLSAGRKELSAELRQNLQSSVEELKQLVASVHDPPADLGERARGIVERLGGEAATRPRAARDDRRIRRYLGNELRSVATEIGEAITVLERDPRNREPLKKLLRAIRPLRGVQAVAEIPAVGPALAAVEEVILRIADTSATVGPGHLALFRRARQALDEVASHLVRGEDPSQITARKADIEGLKEQVLEIAAQRELTWISELFFGDPGPHIEECPMAERGAGSWEAFFALEATGSLDTADRLRTEMARDSENARQIGQRLAYTFRQLRERAVTFGHADLGRIARRAGAAIRAQLEAPPWRLQAIAGDLVVPIRELRTYLQSEDQSIRGEALRRAEESLEAATHPLNEPPVPIEGLTYTPEAALERALALGEPVSNLLNGNPSDIGRARALLDEIFGLIEHALDRSRPAG